MQKIVASVDESIRLDIFLKNHLEAEGISREKIKLMIQEELVFVNDLIAKANYKVKNNDVITYDYLVEEKVEILPVDIPLNIVYEDEDILVINKPTGLVVHPSIGHYNDTLVNALMFHIKDLSGINGEIRPGIVHRIDKDTSGLLVVAKNDSAHTNLSNQIAEKTCKRKYLAIVQGEIPHNLGKINAPIGRDEKDRTKMKVTKNGKPSVTHFEVLEKFKDFTYIKLSLETGRTHQIRVHMNYINYPVCGDVMYGRRKVIGDTGQFLHAYELSFNHPRTGELMTFNAEVEDSFKALLEDLRVNNKITVNND